MFVDWQLFLSSELDTLEMLLFCEAGPFGEYRHHELVRVLPVQVTGSVDEWQICLRRPLHENIVRQVEGPAEQRDIFDGILDDCLDNSQQTDPLDDTPANHPIHLSRVIHHYKHVLVPRLPEQVENPFFPVDADSVATPVLQSEGDETEIGVGEFVDKEVEPAGPDELQREHKNLDSGAREGGERQNVRYVDLDNFELL